MAKIKLTNFPIQTTNRTANEVNKGLCPPLVQEVRDNLSEYVGNDNVVSEYGVRKGILDKLNTGILQGDNLGNGESVFKDVSITEASGSISVTPNIKTIRTNNPDRFKIVDGEVSYDGRPGPGYTEANYFVQGGSKQLLSTGTITNKLNVLILHDQAPDDLTIGNARNIYTETIFNAEVPEMIKKKTELRVKLTSTVTVEDIEWAGLLIAARIRRLDDVLTGIVDIPAEIMAKISTEYLSDKLNIWAVGNKDTVLVPSRIAQQITDELPNRPWNNTFYSGNICVAIADTTNPVLAHNELTTNITEFTQGFGDSGYFTGSDLTVHGQNSCGQSNIGSYKTSTTGTFLLTTEQSHLSDQLILNLIQSSFAYSITDKTFYTIAAINTNTTNKLIGKIQLRVKASEFESIAGNAPLFIGYFKNDYLKLEQPEESYLLLEDGFKILI